MTNKFGVQAYSFCDAYDAENADEKTLETAFKRIKAIGYDEIQTAGFGKVGIEKYVKLAHDAGLEIVGTHYSLNEIFENPIETMRIHEEILGCKFMGISGPPRSVYTKEGFFEFIEKCNKLGEVMKPRGFKLTIHNHHREFTEIDGKKTLMDYLYEYLDPEIASFCFDTHWAQRAGANPTTWIKKLKNRIDILHLKDMGLKREPDFEANPVITPLGEGNMDFDSIMEAAKESNVKYYCVEQDYYDGDPIDGLKISADFLKANYFTDKK